MFTKLKGFAKSLSALFVALIGVGTVSATTALTQAPSTSGSYDYKKYEQSISATAMMHLAAEASQGPLLEMYEKKMELKNNDIEGWKHIEEKTYENNMSYALWVNKYDKTTYVLVYAGTDHIQDTLDYVPMETSENRSKQMNKAVEVAKSIKGTIAQKHAEDAETYGELEKLYICGHSLGGYLSMYIASDLIDSFLGYENTLITIDDIGFEDCSNLRNLKDRLQCVTFGAPGMYYEALKLIPTTHWQKQKIEVNEQHLYDDFITQHVNSRDPVGNLFQYDKLDKFEHLGRMIYYEVDKVSIMTLTDFFMKHKNWLGAGVAYTPIYYHMPWVYVNAINGK